MSVGFGFSVGDIIAAIELVVVIVDALQASGSATTEYRELIGQLASLENILRQLKSLSVNEGQYACLVGLHQEVAQCHQTIDIFWQGIRKYEPFLSNDGTRGGIANLKSAWAKVQWSKCRKEDVARFKLDLVGHTQRIQVRLTPCFEKVRRQ